MSNVPIDDRLATSGQPTLSGLLTLPLRGYRPVIDLITHERVPPEDALEMLGRVWMPRDHWAAFAEDVLRRNGIDFEFDCFRKWRL